MGIALGGHISGSGNDQGSVLQQLPTDQTAHGTALHDLLAGAAPVDGAAVLLLHLVRPGGIVFGINSHGIHQREGLAVKAGGIALEGDLLHRVPSDKAGGHAGHRPGDGIGLVCIVNTDQPGQILAAQVAVFIRRKAGIGGIHRKAILHQAVIEGPGTNRCKGGRNGNTIQIHASGKGHAADSGNAFRDVRLINVEQIIERIVADVGQTGAQTQFIEVISIFIPGCGGFPIGIEGIIRDIAGTAHAQHLPVCAVGIVHTDGPENVFSDSTVLCQAVMAVSKARIAPGGIIGRIENIGVHVRKGEAADFRHISLENVDILVAAHCEGIGTQAGDRSRDDGPAQIIAVVEGLLADGRHLVGNIDGGQGRAGFKGRCGNFGNIRRKRYTGQLFTAVQHLCTQAGHAVRNDNVGQLRAPIEGLVSDGRDTGRDLDPGKIRILERLGANACNTVGNRNLLNYSITETAIRNHRHAVGNIDRCQRIAAGEGILAEGCNAVGNRNRCHLLASVKGILTDGRQGFRQGNGGGIVAFVECIVTDVGNTLLHHDGGDAAGITVPGGGAAGGIIRHSARTGNGQGAVTGQLPLDVCCVCTAVAAAGGRLRRYRHEAQHHGQHQKRA